MPGSNGGSQPHPTLDLDALLPAATPHTVMIKGVAYPVRQIVHFTQQEEEDLRRLEQRLDDAIKSDDPDSYVEARRAAYDQAFWLVRALVPTLPESVRRDITLTQAWAIAGVGRLAVTENPPSADTGTAPDVVSASSAPVSADSTPPIPVPSQVM